MTSDLATQTKYINALAAIMSSLCLKDVLDATVIQYAHLTETNKVAVFLADNQGKTFRLMAAKGYSEHSLQQMRTIPFEAEGIFADILKNLRPAVVTTGGQLNGFNKGVFEREQSISQVALPLVTVDLLIGAILIDSNRSLSIDDNEAWSLITDLTAMGLANAIIYGRSEYERERLNTFYKILSAFHDNVLNLNQVLLKTADAALVLGNTPYCALLLCGTDDPNLSLAAFKGFEGASLQDFDLGNSNTIAAQALAVRKTQQLGKNGQELSGMPRAMGGEFFRSVLALPLVRDEKKIGVLEVFSVDEAAFRSEHIELLEALSIEASNAIYLAQKHESAVSEILHDPHTGLLNRLYFKQGLKAELERSIRHGHQLTLLLIDIDYLSRINDRFGEEKGDETIAKIAIIIQENLRQMDLVYRYGGEEFAVILPETPLKEVVIVVERLIEKVKKVVIPDVGAVTVSIGLSNYPDHTKDPKGLIDLADCALNLAKYQGRDRFVLAPVFSTGADTNAWAELTRSAKQAVSAERRERAKTHLSSSADYSSWPLKMKNAAKDVAVKRDQLPLT